VLSAFAAKPVFYVTPGLRFPLPVLLGVGGNGGTELALCVFFGRRVFIASIFALGFHCQLVLFSSFIILNDLGFGLVKVSSELNGLFVKNGFRFKNF
jgi:hypothetical protein